MENKNNFNNILKNDILMLIMDYLYSTDLIDSLITIEKETKRSIFSYNKELFFLRKLIIEGNWDEAENFLYPLKSNSLFDFSSAIYSLKLQKFFETTETDSINYNQNEIELQLKDIRNYSKEEQFKELLNLLNKNSIREEPKYKNWTINRGRLKTFEKIRKLLEVIYPVNKQKEKNVKDNLLIDFFVKIFGNEKIKKKKLINGIISIINGTSFNYSQNKNNSNIYEKNNNPNEKSNKREESNIYENNKKNKDILRNNEKNIINEKQKGKIRPQSSLGIKNKKTEIDASSQFDKKYSINLYKNGVLNEDLNKDKKKEAKINNNLINKNVINPSNNQINDINVINDNNFENEDISIIPNYTETSSLIKDTKKIITNLSEENIKNKKMEQNIMVSKNIIHKIESSYDLYSYDPSSFSLDSLLVDSHAIRAISFSNNGKILSLGTNSKSLKLYDFSPINNKFLLRNNTSSESPKLLFEKPNHHAGSIYCLDFSSNDKLIATGSNDKMVKIFVIPDFSQKMTEILELAIPDQHGTVRTVIFPRVDENYVFSGGNGDKNIYMWDTDSGKRINSLIGHEKDINSLKFSIDENSQVKLLGSCGMDKNICFHDYRTNNPVKSYQIENHGEINDITFSNDFICSVHNDGYICLFNNNVTDKIIKEFKVSNKELRAVNFSKDGKFLMTASFDNKISIFDINNEMKLVKSLKHEDRAVNCKWHPDKPIIVSSSADNTAIIWTPKIY